MDSYWLEINENKYGSDDRDVYGDGNGDDEYDDMMMTRIKMNK